MHKNAVDSDIESAACSSLSSSFIVPTPRSIPTRSSTDFSQLSSDSFLDSGLSGSEYGYASRPVSANSDISSSSSNFSVTLTSKSLKCLSLYQDSHKIYKTIYKQTRKRELQQLAEKVKGLKKSKDVNSVILTNLNGIPLPELSFTDKKQLWSSMVAKVQNPDYHVSYGLYLKKHPQVTAKMRAVLIDWLIDVCQVYQLHRETFYLALDFLARYMTKTQTPIKRQTLQLIGVTCLFTAAKLEEIYPPKCHEFAYVTDGACTAEQIKETEIKVCETLSWKLQPVTPQAWLCMFLQIAQFKSNNISSESSTIKDEFKAPFPVPSGKETHFDPVLTPFQTYKYPQRLFVQMSQLMDASIMDVKSLKYPYPVLAASCLYHFSSKNLVVKSTGYKLTELSNCIEWMSIHAENIKNTGLAKLRSFKRAIPEDWHNLQTHDNKLDDILTLLKKERAKDQLKIERTASVVKMAEIQKLNIEKMANDYRAMKIGGSS